MQVSLAVFSNCQLWNSIYIRRIHNCAIRILSLVRYDSCHNSVMDSCYSDIELRHSKLNCGFTICNYDIETFVRHGTQ